MTSTPGDAARQILKRTTQPTAACLAIERFAEPLTQAERGHIAGCLRCQAEAALWDSFNDATPRHGEDAAVRGIVEALKRSDQKRAGGRTPAGITRWLSWRPLSAVAAALVLAVAVGYVARDREPEVAGTDGAAPTYRSAQVQLRSPAGDQSVVPTQLEWVAVPGAASYDVSLLEVDRTVLFRDSVAGQRLVLPSSVTVRLVPGKTVMWQVAARDSSGNEVARSGTQSFRIAVNK